MVLLFMMMNVNLYGLVLAPTCCEGAFGKSNFKEAATSTPEL